MKITKLGDIAQVAISTKFEELKEFSEKTPVKLYDKDTKNAVYAVKVGTTPSLTAVGCVFTYADAEGNAAMNVPVNENVIKEYEEALIMLQDNEESIARSIEMRKEERASLEALVVNN